MTKIWITASLSLGLITYVYCKGSCLTKERPTSIRVILSLFCSGATLFVWDLLTIALIDKSVFIYKHVEGFILVFGCFVLFVFFMALDKSLINWRVWFPKPVGFHIKNLEPKKRNFVYADSIAIKGDGWIRR